MSRLLQAEPPVENTQLYKNKGRDSGPNGKSVEKRDKFLALRLIYPENWGYTFLRNVGSHKIYTAHTSQK
jgi:hypothetical protein